MTKKIINLTDILLNPHVWHFEEGGAEHYSCHCHYMSPYESDDSCGNCDGTGCSVGNFDSYPRVYTEEDKLTIDRFGNPFEMNEFYYHIRKEWERYGLNSSIALKVMKYFNLNPSRTEYNFIEGETEYEFSLDNSLEFSELYSLTERATDFYTKLFEIYNI